MKRVLLLSLVLVLIPPAFAQQPTAADSGLVVISATHKADKKLVENGIAYHGSRDALDRERALPDGENAGPRLELSDWTPYERHTYRAVVRNDGEKVVKRVEWRYEFHYDLGAQGYGWTGQEFSCKKTIRPGETVELGQGGKTNVDGAGKSTKVVDGKVVRVLPWREQATITKVVYEDGSTWTLPVRPPTR